MILVDEKKLGNALKACLSDSEFPLERRQAVLRAIRKEEKVVKKKISAALVFAIVLTLVVGGAALAANLGVFGQSVNDQQNEQSVGRLEKLENASATYNDTQAAQAPEQTATEAPKTVYDELMASLYNRRFNLTLNQAYFDGYKLYYSYTLTSDCKTGFITGDGMPTGFEKWDDTQEGKFVGHYSLYDDNMNQEVVTYFSAHPKGYIAFESMGVGDGAAMNGKPLMILDSGSEMVNEYTIQGYQEVERPDGFEPTDEIEIEMSILYGMSVYCQDENNVYFSHLMTPENRGIFRLPFKVKLNGLTFSFSGLENKMHAFYAATGSPADTAKYVLNCVCSCIVSVTREALKQYPGFPVVFSGGVASNAQLRQSCRDFDAVFSPPEFSTDNAMGIAVLTWLQGE